MKLTNEWISGFVDGDGCFSISQMNKKVNGQGEALLRFRFIVSQDQRSTDVLYALKKHFGCGTVCKSGGGGNMMEFSITNREHLWNRVVPHFVKYPLQTMKRVRFREFVDTLYEYMEKRGALATSRPQLFLEKYHCTPDWFRGIVDADGCFSVSIVNGYAKPRFLLAMQRGEGGLIQECQRFLGCGTLHTRKDGLETLQVSKLMDLEEQLVPLFETRGSAVLLRTIKRISFQKWRKIVRLMSEGRHLDLAGLEKIKKYQLGLNKHNRSLTDQSG